MTVAMMGIEREEAGYEKAERKRFEHLARETTIAVGIVTVAAVFSNPVETFFGWIFGGLFGGEEDGDDEPAPDYSRAERIPEDYR
jgi:hypothetical protein